VALSAGAIGPGRLGHVGANALVVAPFLAMELAVGALPAAATGAWWRRRRTGAPTRAAVEPRADPSVGGSAGAPVLQPPSSLD
jgi:hypothetical protein